MVVLVRLVKTIVAVRRFYALWCGLLLSSFLVLTIGDLGGGVCWFQIS
jgi:hypothetical protein